jgi:Ca-activated chloride channel homolog
MNHFANPHFAEPQWLWLAVLGPLALLGLQRYSAWARKRQLSRVAAPGFLKQLTASHSPARRLVKDGLLLLAVAAVGLALARPQWGEQEQTTRMMGQDVLFVLDCSESMMAQDVTPNRLERCKLAILNFVQRHGRGRVGLVSFAGEAFLQCPLTYDYGAFEEALNAINDKTIPVPGTDIGRALDEAYRAMDKRTGQKLLVLLTDGEDLEGRGIRVARKLAKDGVVVFTLGVGTPAGTDIQIKNALGQTQPLRDRYGRVVRSRLDEKTLRAIALATHGAYYPLGPVGEGLAKVRIAAETMEFSSGLAPAQRWGVDRFAWPVSGLLVLLVGESMIGTRRGPRRLPLSP